MVLKSPVNLKLQFTVLIFIAARQFWAIAENSRTDKFNIRGNRNDRYLDYGV